ncbi:MAG: hypothetical protein HY069_00945 [Chlamydiia bacterium]|nr:hypothetical protein [Chlamydiia bacterium]
MASFVNFGKYAQEYAKKQIDALPAESTLTAAQKVYLGHRYEYNRLALYSNIAMITTVALAAIALVTGMPIVFALAVATFLVRHKVEQIIGQLNGPKEPTLYPVDANDPNSDFNTDRLRSFMGLPKNLPQPAPAQPESASQTEGQDAAQQNPAPEPKAWRPAYTAVSGSLNLWRSAVTTKADAIYEGSSFNPHEAKMVRLQTAIEQAIAAAQQQGQPQQSESQQA